MNKRCVFGYDRTTARVVSYVLYVPVRFDLPLLSTTSHHFYLFFKTANAIWLPLFIHISAHLLMIIFNCF